MARIARLRVLGVLAVAVVALTGVSACTNPDASASGSGSEDIVDSEGAPSGPTGTLRLGAYQELSSFDPVLVISQQASMIHATYDTLTTSTPTGEVGPWLATSWSQPDPNTWEFNLRDDVVFHDGSAFDAETVKVNLERAKMSSVSPSVHIYQPITAVTVVDPLTVQVQFSTPQPGFPLNMSTTAGAMISPKAIADGTDLTRTPAGSGGWLWDPDAHVEGSKHVFHANPDYWNPEALKVETLEFSILTEPSSRINALQSGQVDIAASIDATQLGVVEDFGMKVVSSYSASQVLLILDREGTLVPAFADERVRKAMSLLINRESYNAAVHSGNGNTTGGFAAPGSWWYSETLEDAAPASVDEAKKLLADAGYADGFAFDAPNVASVRIRNETIAQLLAEGGITMNLIEEGDNYNAAVRKGVYPAAHISPTSSDPFVWWTRSLSNNSAYNPFGLSDMADLEELFVAASASSDLAEQKSLLEQLQSEVLERGVAIVLGHGPTSFALAPNIYTSKEILLTPVNEVLPRPHYLWVA